MGERSSSQKRKKRTAQPLDPVRLRDLALAHVARYATSSGKLANYLKRKLRERGWEGEGDPDLDALCQRFAELGYLDDAHYAEAKTRDLMARGYGPRRIAQTLGADGIAQGLREDLAPDEADRRLAALRLARKRRFGPFYGEELPPERREKQIAAMLRAGHGFDHVRNVIDAVDEESLEIWVSEAQDWDGM